MLFECQVSKRREGAGWILSGRFRVASDEVLNLLGRPMVGLYARLMFQMDFLRHVLSQTRKHLIVIQDGARYHTSQDMQAFFYDHKDRLTVYQMPAYSPDYNPIEILWKKVKKQGVHLKHFPTFESLIAKVDELLANFAASSKEVLKVFGFYTKRCKA